MMNVLIVGGIVSIVVSFGLWGWQPGAARVATTQKHWPQIGRGILFVVWTVGPPLWFLWQWRFYPPQPADLAAFEYGQKLWSDFWVSIVAVLVALFGIKKP